MYVCFQFQAFQNFQYSLKKLKTWEKLKKKWKKFGEKSFRRKGFGSDNKIRPWLWFLRLTPGFGHTLLQAFWDRLMAFCPFCPRRTCSSCIPTTSWWPLLRIPTATMIYSYKCYPKNSKFQTSLMKKIKLRPFKFLAAIDSIALVPLLFLSRV